MKANELMIGDWVKSRGKIEQVTSVYEGYICTDTFEDSHDYFFEPIPLTPEILEKNVFKDSQFFAELLCGEWQILCDCSHIAMRHIAGWSVDIPCGYIHELQHALRLCGIEKEIVL